MRVRSNDVAHYTTRGCESKQALVVIAKNSTLVTKLHYFDNYYNRISYYCGCDKDIVRSKTDWDMVMFGLCSLRGPLLPCLDGLHV
jgi:hypothetical protein